MSVLNELIEYRERYLKRADEKINRTFLSMIERCISHITDLEEQLKHQDRIVECKQLDWFYIERVLKMPQCVYERFIKFVAENNPDIRDIEDLISDCVIWEMSAQAKIEELKFWREARAGFDDNTPEEFRKLAQEMMDDFQLKTRIIINTTNDAEIDKQHLDVLRCKYIDYLIKKYDKRRNR